MIRIRTDLIVSTISHLSGVHLYYFYKDKDADLLGDETMKSEIEKIHTMIHLGVISSTKCEH